MQPFIYGLVDPAEPKHVRYVGMSNVREGRPYDHARAARRPNTKVSYTINWIRKIQSEGREPEFIKLEELASGTTSKFLGFVEQCYIKSLREIGHRLTNATDGGEYGDSGPLSPEGRAKRSASMRGNTNGVGTIRSQESVAALSARNIGNKYSVGRHHSEEETKKRVASFLRTQEEHPEIRVKKSESLKAYYAKPENSGEARERAMKAWATKRANGYIVSEEHKAKNRAAQNARWAAKKAEQCPS